MQLGMALYADPSSLEQALGVREDVREGNKSTLGGEKERRI